MQTKTKTTKGAGAVRFEAIRVRPASDAASSLIVAIDFTALVDGIEAERAALARAHRVAAFLLEGVLPSTDTLGSINVDWATPKTLRARIRVETEAIAPADFILFQYVGAMQAICEGVHQ